MKKRKRKGESFASMSLSIGRHMLNPVIRKSGNPNPVIRIRITGLVKVRKRIRTTGLPDFVILKK